MEEALKEPEKVFYLDLSFQGLSVLPKEIGMLKNLEYLDLRSNKISKKNIEQIRQLFEKNTVEILHN